MSADLAEAMILDSYPLIRFIGQGGFGEVWLCRSETIVNYWKLKFIPTIHKDRFEKGYLALIHEQAKAATQLSSNEIIAMLRPTLLALESLSDVGLVHRDVKPENILLFNGQPYLGDMGLLVAYAATITRRGTTGFGTQITRRMMHLSFTGQENVNQDININKTMIYQLITLASLKSTCVILENFANDGGKARKFLSFPGFS